MCGREGAGVVEARAPRPARHPAAMGKGRSAGAGTSVIREFKGHVAPGFPVRVRGHGLHQVD